MTLILVVLGVVILVAIVGFSARRGSSPRRGSVNDYEHAMDTLARMSGRPSSSATGQGWMGHPAEPLSPPARSPETGATALAGLKSSASKGGPATWMRAASIEPGSSGARRSRSIGRVGRLAGGVIGLVVLIGLTVTVVSLAVGRSGHTNPPAARSAQAGGAGTSPTTTPGHSSTRPTSRPNTGRPTTTIPSNQVTAVSNDANGATYNAPTTGYMLSFTTTGPCWVRVTDATGTIMFQKTLPGGASGQLNLAGSSQVRVGNAAHVSLQVDGKPVIVPQTVPLPYNLTFQAA